MWESWTRWFHGGGRWFWGRCGFGLDGLGVGFGCWGRIGDWGGVNLFNSLIYLIWLLKWSMIDTYCRHSLAYRLIPGFAFTAGFTFAGSPLIGGVIADRARSFLFDNFFIRSCVLETWISSKSGVDFFLFFSWFLFLHD